MKLRKRKFIPVQNVEVLKSALNAKDKLLEDGMTYQMMPRNSGSTVGRKRTTSLKNTAI